MKLISYFVCKDRDLEVLETDDDLVQRIKEVYFVKASDESSTLIAESEDESVNRGFCICILEI